MHPEIQQRVYQEIKTTLGDSKEITESHIGKMSYLKAVTRETHRYDTEPTVHCHQVLYVVLYSETLSNHKHLCSSFTDSCLSPLEISEPPPKTSSCPDTQSLPG